MAAETTQKQADAALIEKILDQACLDAGMSELQIEQSKRIAVIEERLVASGRSIKDVYKEWETKTPEQILEEYADITQSPFRQTQTVVTVGQLQP